MSLSRFLSKNIIWILTVLALVVRLVNLDTSLWYDEGFSGHLSRLSLGDLIVFLAEEDVHPPLYFLLTNFWALVFSGDYALRCLSVLLGTATVPVFFALCRELFNSQTAIVATAFLVVSPFHVHLSQEVRPYSLYVLLSVIAIWLVLKTQETSGVMNRWGFTYSLITALILYTHGVGPLIVAGLIALHFCISIPNVRKAVKQILFYNAFAVLLFLPWLPTVIRQSHRADVHDWLPDVSLTSILQTVQWFVYSPPFADTSRAVHYLWLLPPGLLLVCVIFISDRNMRRKLTGLVFFVLVPIALISVYGYLKSPVFVPRVLAPVILSLFMLMALPLSVFHRPALIVASRILAAAFLLFSIVSLSSDLQRRGQRGWRTAAETIASRAAPNDAVLVLPEKAKYVFGYYFRPGLSTPSHVFSATTEMDARAELEDFVRSGTGRIWVVRDDVVSSGITEDSIAWMKTMGSWEPSDNLDNLTLISVTPNR